MALSGVLVLGATTPIGRAVVRTLLEDSDVPCVMAAGVEEDPGLLPSADSRRLRYVRADLSRARSIRELMFGRVREAGIDAIVHVAQHRRASDDGARVHAVNVEATREIMHLCRRHPTVKRLVLRSYGEVYRVRADAPSVIDEEWPLDLSPETPQWVRDRVEADLAACACLGTGPLDVTVLRCAECVAPDCGSQLHDYLEGRLCLRPLGYDPMVNLLSIVDLARAVRLALAGPAGVYNVPGADTLPLTQAIARWGRTAVPVPDFIMLPLYSLRSRLLGTDFRYDLSRWRFHFSSVLEGRRARDRLGYVPQFGVEWPALPSWR